MLDNSLEVVAISFFSKEKLLFFFFETPRAFCFEKSQPIENSQQKKGEVLVELVKILSQKLNTDETFALFDHRKAILKLVNRKVNKK